VILVDTSVWIDHLRQGDTILADMLEHGQVLGHPFVIGELATGSPRQRDVILHALRGLPGAVVAHDWEVLDFIERETLCGSGLGYIAAHLLASVRLTAGALLFTRDKRLHAAAPRIHCGTGLALTATRLGISIIDDSQAECHGRQHSGIRGSVIASLLHGRRKRGQLRLAVLDAAKSRVAGLRRR
jgi:predicted nucleic acid-binding protein